VSEWTYEYDNEGNGHFAEWWNLLCDGKVVGKLYFDNEEEVEEFIDVLKSGEELTEEVNGWKFWLGGW